MKKRKEIERLRERVAALEARLEEQAKQIRSVSDQHHQRDRLAIETWCKTTEVLRVTWEALQGARSLPLPPCKADDEAQAPPRSL
jgi:archaellum component FlaC